MTFNKDYLTTVAKEALNPLKEAIADAIMVQFDGEALVWDLVEGFTEEHGIHLVAIV